MGRRTTFRSTIGEKAQLLKKLESAPQHNDVETAIRVVKDAQTLHDLHRMVVDLEEGILTCRYQIDPAKYIALINKINKFYDLVEKRNRRGN